MVCVCVRARARVCVIFILFLSHIITIINDFNIIANYFKIITVMCFLRK